MKNYELRITNYELPLARIFCALCLFCSSAFFVNAQSINQNSPTPIVSNEIGGRIPARDLGDARLTTYYYTFDGNQGDVFINVVTTNFNGDIDVFTADNLRPLTKITAYADSPNNETGRVVYLRQPLKLILRIEGRTPNDDAATFQIKFAGSFAPSTAIAQTSDAPEVKSVNETDVRVNSVGTIIEIKPKPTPTPKITVAKVEKPPKERKPQTVAENKREVEKNPAAVVVEKTDAEKVTPETTVAETETKENIVKEPIVEPEPVKVIEPVKEEKSVEPQPSPTEITDEKVTGKETEVTEKKPETDVKEETPPVETKETTKPSDDKSAVKEENKPAKSKKKSNAVKSVPPSELASINLIILFKDGTKIERPMSEVLKVGVDKGILTVISKDGAIGRYSILDVEKMTIQ